VRQLAGERLLTPPDTLERHQIVAKLLGAPVSVLDVGGVPGQLAPFLPLSKIVAANVVEPADILIPGDRLPFSDRSFTATTSLDALEHVAPHARAGFVAELLRVTEHRSVLCCPCGSPEHDGLESEIDAWYRELTGDGHPWLREHLQYGLPRPEDVRELYREAGVAVRMAYHGDARETAEQFKAMVLARHRHRPADVARFAAFRVRYRPSTELADEPTPWTNRMFCIADVDPVS
jgi:hypothetical protein